MGVISLSPFLRYEKTLSVTLSDRSFVMSCDEEEASYSIIDNNAVIQDFGLLQTGHINMKSAHILKKCLLVNLFSQFALDVKSGDSGQILLNVFPICSTKFSFFFSNNVRHEYECI